MLCSKMSSALLRIREPSGAEGLPTVPFNLFDNNLKTFATLAADELRRVSIYSVKAKFKCQHKNIFGLSVSSNNGGNKLNYHKNYTYKYTQINI